MAQSAQDHCTVQYMTVRWSEPTSNLYLHRSLQISVSPRAHLQNEGNNISNSEQNDLDKQESFLPSQGEDWTQTVMDVGTKKLWNTCCMGVATIPSHCGRELEKS
jgi:hypothetical protein